MSFMSFNNKILIHEGSSKNLYQGANNDMLHMSYKNKLDFISNANILHNQISANFFSCLNARHIQTHFIKTTSLSDQTIYNTKVLPIRIRITNIIHHDFHVKLGMSVGQELPEPLIDIISNYTGTIIDSAYLPIFNICTAEQLQQIRQMSMRINDILCALFHIHDITPASIDLSFGMFNGTFTIDRHNGIMLIDELTPNTMQFWHKKNNTILEYDTDLIKLLAPAINLNTSRWHAELNDNATMTKLQYTQMYNERTEKYADTNEIHVRNKATGSKNNNASAIHNAHNAHAQNTDTEDTSEMNTTNKKHNSRQNENKITRADMDIEQMQRYDMNNDMRNIDEIQDHHDMFALPQTNINAHNANVRQNKISQNKPAKTIQLNVSDKSIF